ncbi:RNA polymerase sigma factor [Dyadobacter pollutisoli]|uniref:RNA polymerase sigma factor n=1 Tax=Dyadobacter pollutisoli TaxID=2910158 RepID=A0A9E8NCG6_9BACT|nr:RNA polymerase sigma factor [Dyadobacter pollutisoli]WAC14125.1 RNA polymerase sigma factor [Dyadobacter pollutisoli]
MDKRSDNFWEATYRQNIAKMIGVCCRYTQNRQTAEDLAHDAFLVAIDKVSSFENKGPFEAWLRRIAVNVALQHLRVQKREQRFVQIAAYATPYDDIPDGNAGNENLTFSETELLEVISYLPEHHRLVFNLYVVDNFTHAQIAAQLGISQGTSKSHLARARKKIRELLSDRLRKDKERKRGFVFLLFPYKLWSIDNLFAATLRDLLMQPTRDFSISNINLNQQPIPKYRPTGISNSIYLKTGVWGIASVAILVSISNWHFNAFREDSSPVMFDSANSVADTFQDLNSNTSGTNQNLFSDSSSATISQNSIIGTKTKNLEPMKNFSTLGGLLLASLTFDSSALMNDLPVQFKNQQLVTSRILEPERIVEGIKPAVVGNSRLLSGTFYASEILWSDDRYKLILFGDHVKVDINTQKFTGRGKFSFLSGIKHLVVDGTPMKLNERIKLTDRKYHLEELNASEATKKYGDAGREGAVEITLAE